MEREKERPKKKKEKEKEFQQSLSKKKKEGKKDGGLELRLLSAVEIDDSRSFLDGDAVPVEGALRFPVVEDVARVEFGQRFEASSTATAAGVHFSENHQHGQRAHRRQ